MSKNQPEGQIAERGKRVTGYIVGLLVIGSLVGVGVLLTRALARVPATAPQADDNLVGALGTVVIRIPESGAGEVTIPQPGQHLRVPAVAEAPISAGATVVVVDVTTPESVVVAESGF